MGTIEPAEKHRWRSLVRISSLMLVVATPVFVANLQYSRHYAQHGIQADPDRLFPSDLVGLVSGSAALLAVVGLLVGVLAFKRDAARRMRDAGDPDSRR